MIGYHKSLILSRDFLMYFYEFLSYVLHRIYNY
nr:MAG TPA: hypothetical protein [Caudoviricetes sp.]